MIRVLICLVTKKPNLIVTELFIRVRKLNMYLIFITQFFFSVAKNTRLNSAHFYYENFEQMRVSINCS